jgi:hypothetical protein
LGCGVRGSEFRVRGPGTRVWGPGSQVHGGRGPEYFIKDPFVLIFRESFFRNSEDFDSISFSSFDVSGARIVRVPFKFRPVANVIKLFTDVSYDFS